MYLNEEESRILARNYADIVRKISTKDKHKIILCPSFISIPAAREELKGADKNGFAEIFLGAQDGYWAELGAYTGAVSMRILADSGVKYVIVGHSERRYLFGETNLDIQKKLEAALEFSLVPILCVGETKKERDDGRRDKVLVGQLSVLKNFFGQNSGPGQKETQLIIAYEPVWSVGTGDYCDSADVKEAVKVIISAMKNMGVDTANTPILYGGSISSKILKDYLKIPDINGVLVGGASVKPKEVEAMLNKICHTIF